MQAVRKIRDLQEKKLRTSTKKSCELVKMSRFVDNLIDWEILRTAMRAVRIIRNSQEKGTLRTAMRLNVKKIRRNDVNH